MDSKQESVPVRISPAAHKQLVSLHSLYGGSYGGLVEAMIAHAARSGVDPRTPHAGGVADQLKGMNKRLNQVIAFFQEHEKKKTGPLLDGLANLLQQQASDRAQGTERDARTEDHLAALRTVLEIHDGRLLDLLHLPEAERADQMREDKAWFDIRKRDFLSQPPPGEGG